MRGGQRLRRRDPRDAGGLVAPGVTTGDLDARGRGLARARAAAPAFTGYRGYPATFCTSVNEEVVHGIPRSDGVIREGDIVSARLRASAAAGYFGDAARTVPVGRVTRPATRAARGHARSRSSAASRRCAPSSRVLATSARPSRRTWKRTASASCASSSGTGSGRRMHEEPQVPNFGERGRGTRLRRGMVLAIEPMVNVGHVPRSRCCATAGRP